VVGGVTGSTEALRARLEAALPAWLSAHDVLGMAGDEAGGGAVHHVHVQGRGDRLHVFWICGHDDDDAAVDAFLRAAANWRWFVLDEAAGPAAEAAWRARGAAAGAGVVRVGGGGARKAVDALPHPGIFLPAYPALRQRWRAISSW
jgi:hypothetical protein